MTRHDHDHAECLDAPAMEVRVSRDGVTRIASDGTNPRLLAQILRRVADSFDATADERGVPPIPELRSEVTMIDDPEEAERLIAQHRASDPRSTANLN